jgi:hypothetical protein
MQRFMIFVVLVLFVGFSSGFGQELVREHF